MILSPKLSRTSSSNQPIITAPLDSLPWTCSYRQQTARSGCTAHWQTSTGSTPPKRPHFLPPGSSDGGSYHGYAQDQAFVWPYYGLGSGIGMGAGNLARSVTTDTLPAGEVAIRRSEPAKAIDGEIGRVQGLVIAAATHHVTHVLLQEGHLWGRKHVAFRKTVRGPGGPGVAEVALRSGR